MAFFSHLSYSLWSIRLHACQLCSLAFMSTDVYNKPIAIVWHEDLIYFCSSHTQCHMESWDIFVILCFNQIWIQKSVIAEADYHIAWTLCSQWMLFFWHHSTGPSEIFYVVKGEVNLWVVLIGQWHSQTHLHLTLNAVTLCDVWKEKDCGQKYIITESK